MKTKLFCLWICFALFLVACEGKKSYKTSDETVDTVALGIKNDTSLATLKLIKTAGMRFKVKNVQHTCEDVANLTASYHGLVMHHNMQSTVNKNYDSALSNDSVMHVSLYNTTADMIVRIPSDKMEDFMNSVGHMALYIDTLNMNVEDKTLDYLSAGLKMKDQKDLIAHPNTAANKGTDVQAVKNDIFDKRINARRIDAEVKYSTISLSFYQINTIVKQVTVVDDPSAFRVPFTTQLGNAISTGWSAMSDVVVFLANGWVLFVLAAIGWYAWRYFSKKKVVANVA